MKKILIVAIVAVVIVAAAGVTLYTSQAPRPETNGLAAIEQKLNDRQNAVTRAIWFLIKRDNSRD